MRICPVCESALFDDMDTCFGCLYRFGSDPALEEARGATAVLWPTASEEERVPLDNAGSDATMRVLDGAGGIEEALGGGDLEGGRSVGSVREVDVPGWRLRVRSEGPLPRGSALVIEIEPAP